MDSIENFLLNKLDLRLSNRHFAKEQILKNDFKVDQLIDLIHVADAKQKVHLLCFCDTFSREDLLYFENHFQFFINLSKNETNETNKRSLTNLYIGMLKFARNKLTNNQKNSLTEVCFMWLLNESLVATKSNCITCLDFLSKDNQWIADELKAIIEQIYPEMPVSFQSRARKIMEKTRRK